MTKQECMDTKTQWEEIHYTGKHECTKTIGPRKGEHVNITRVRASGKCQTWKRDEKRFRLPVKYGMYESSAIDQDNCEDFHLAVNCPIK